MKIVFFIFLFSDNFIEELLALVYNDIELNFNEISFRALSQYMKYNNIIQFPVIIILHASQINILFIKKIIGHILP